MMCDRCGQPSVYHSTLIVNGVSQKTNLCRDCAIKEGVFNSNSLFENMFSPFFQDLKIDSIKDIVCPVCKTSLREFKSTGILGCPNCYDVFRDEISNILKRIAPFEAHKQDAIKVKTLKNEKPSKEEQIASLITNLDEVYV